MAANNNEQTKNLSSAQDGHDFFNLFSFENCSNNSATLHAHPVLLFKTTRKDNRPNLTRFTRVQDSSVNIVNRACAKASYVFYLAENLSLCTLNYSFFVLSSFLLTSLIF